MIVRRTEVPGATAGNFRRRFVGQPVRMTTVPATVSVAALAAGGDASSGLLRHGAAATSGDFSLAQCWIWAEMNVKQVPDNIQP